MDVTVKHNGSSITSYVIGYRREHKICTGIGLLTIEVSKTISDTFDPWDTIDIHENGSFKNRYYVSSVDESVPAGTYKIECQDNSKRLVDYFIPDSYTIDYPSYTRYWIEKFLDEAGVSSYSFTVTTNGNLISNDTVLGLMPAYEQLLTLLQMSGWYMYFDGNGQAIIGDLQKELSPVDASLTRSTIHDILMKKDDRMLRNRALVMGNYNPVTDTQITADVSVVTPYNYDSNDLRTVVISNHNIPNISTAYGMANQIVKEFAKITVEKHLTVIGAEDLQVGSVVGVKTTVWTGKGLVTTFGTELSKTGLVTNLVLDERCPRLYGFFDFGDYVYVSTFGSGVWRKHVQFDPTWYDFSTGLGDELNVTDLHVNNGLLTCVTESGSAYYSADDSGPWNILTIPETLESSSEDIATYSGDGGGLIMATYSGFMARATIIDRDYNTLIFGVDTWSGLNTGDYFLTLSGYYLLGSGIITPSGLAGSGLANSGQHRAWLLEYDPLTGNLMGGLGSGIYPISYSGNYDMLVVDVENDTRTDYVSVLAGGTYLENDGISWNYGHHTGQPYAETQDGLSYAPTPENIAHVNANTTGTLSFGQNVLNSRALIAYDNELAGEMEVISMKYGGAGHLPKFLRNKLTREITGTDTTSVTRSSITSPDTEYSATGGEDGLLGLIKLGTDSYRVYFMDDVTYLPTLYIYYIDWNTADNTVTPKTLLATINLEYTNDINVNTFNVLIKNDISYILYYYIDDDGSRGPTSQTYIRAYTIKIDLPGGGVTAKQTLKLALPYEPVAGVYYYVPTGNPITSGASKGYDTSESVTTDRNWGMNFFLNGSSGTPPMVLGWVKAHQQRLHDGVSTPYITNSVEYLITGTADTILADEIYENHEVLGDIAERYWNQSSPTSTYSQNLQLTANRCVKYFQLTNSTTGDLTLCFVNDGIIEIAGALPDHLIYDYVTPILNAGSTYVSYDSATFDYYLSNAETITKGTVINPPSGYTINGFYSTPIIANTGDTMVSCFDDSSNRCVVPFLNGSFYTSRRILSDSVSINVPGGIQIGGFFIANASSWLDTDPIVSVCYIDMLTPKLDAGSSFLLLQRSGSDFRLIREAGWPIRADISCFSPVLTLLDTEHTFKSYNIFQNEALVTTIEATASGTLNQVPDYRYAMLASGIAGSGILGSGLSKEALYLISGSGAIYAADTATLQSGVIYADLTDQLTESGYLSRIETTNYSNPEPYIFVTTAGDVPNFYQKDSDSDLFVYYSGLPAKRATMIRIDDKV